MKAAPSTSTSHNILAFNGVCSHFQPIVSTRQRAVVGLEALTRGIPETGEMSAIESFARLLDRNDGLVLFTSLDPSVVPSDAAIVDHLHDMCYSAGISPRNVAIEFHQSRIADFSDTCVLVERLQRSGFLVVLDDVDDVDAGHSNLNRIPVIRPDIIKVGRALIENISSDCYRQETLRSLVGLARRLGAMVVAGGVETEMEAIVSLELGADLLQGSFVSPAQKTSSLNVRVLADAIERVQILGSNFKSYMVGKINERKLRHRRFNVILNQMLCELTSAEVGEFDHLLSRSIGDYPAVECAYVLDHRGEQVTDTICNDVFPRQNGGVMFRPAPKGTDHSLKEYFYLLLDVELEKFTTNPYVSLATGNLCRTISTPFRDAANSKTYVLCIDVCAEDSDLI